jgi:hypothetical protein
MHEESDLDLSHLLPSVQVQARLPADERIRHVRADRWIGYPRALSALERLETLFAWPSRQRMPNLLLIGPTNNGKSMLVEKFRRSHPSTVSPDREDIPVLCVQMPSRAIGVALLHGAARRPGRTRWCRANGLPTWSGSLRLCCGPSGCGCW